MEPVHVGPSVTPDWADQALGCDDDDDNFSDLTHEAEAYLLHGHPGKGMSILSYWEASPFFPVHKYPF